LISAIRLNPKSPEAHGSLGKLIHVHFVLWVTYRGNPCFLIAIIFVEHFFNSANFKIL